MGGHTVKEVVHETGAHHATVALGLHRLPVQSVLVPQFILLVGYPRVNVNDQDLVSQWLSPPRRIFLDLVDLARRIGICRLVYRIAYGLVQPEERVAEGGFPKDGAIVVTQVICRFFG